MFWNNEMLSSDDRDLANNLMQAIKNNFFETTDPAVEHLLSCCQTTITGTSWDLWCPSNDIAVKLIINYESFLKDKVRGKGGISVIGIHYEPQNRHYLFSSTGPTHPGNKTIRDILDWNNKAT